MAKTPKNHGKPITPSLVKEVKELAAQNTPIKVIGVMTGRTEHSIYGIASANSISLKPTNQRYYHTKKNNTTK